MSKPSVKTALSRYMVKRTLSILGITRRLKRKGTGKRRSRATILNLQNLKNSPNTRRGMEPTIPC